MSDPTESPKQAPQLRIVRVDEEATPPISIRTIQRGDGYPKKKKWLPWIIAIASSLFTLLCIAVYNNFKDAPSRDEQTKRAQQQEYNAAEEEGERVGAQAPIYSGPRAFVKKFIEEKDNCRIVAITKRNGDVAVANDNDWAVSSCPGGLKNALQSITDAEQRIIDVCLTESGRWIVVYDDCCASWYSIPSDLEAWLRRFNEEGEEVYSVSFNDAGDWILVSDVHYSCSNTYLSEWLEGGIDNYGRLLSAAVSEDAAVAVFENGFLFYGNVPNDLKQALRETELDVRIIKMAGQSWFFADEYGAAQYRL